MIFPLIITWQSSMFDDVEWGLPNQTNQLLVTLTMGLAAFPGLIRLIIILSDISYWYPRLECLFVFISNILLYNLQFNGDLCHFIFSPFSTVSLPSVSRDLPHFVLWHLIDSFSKNIKMEKLTPEKNYKAANSRFDFILSQVILYIEW